MQQKFWLILLLSLFDNFYKVQIGTDATGAGQKSTVKTGGHGRKHHRSTPTGSESPRTMNSSPVELHRNSIVHAWIKSVNEGKNASLMFRGSRYYVSTQQDPVIAFTPQHIAYKFFEIKLDLEDNLVQFHWDPKYTLVSYIYVYEEETVFEQGIRPVFINAATKTPTLPDSYHFRPPLGWMNDPNGFSKVGEYYHLFYQNYPHAKLFKAMSWGHAVSKDLINFVHLPLFLQPNPELMLEHHNEFSIGGIWSGSAIAIPEQCIKSGTRPNALRVFYTDCDQHREPAEIQYQRTGISLNGISLHGSADRMPIKLPTDHNLSIQDFRDPAVFIGPNNKYQMVLGSKDADGGVVLLYGTDDPCGAKDWHYQGILQRDNRFGMTVAECSSFQALGDPSDPETLWFLLYSRGDSVCPLTGRKNLSPIIVGRFDGREFVPIFEQEFDFGTYAYAFQPFRHDNQVTGIAWLSNWDIDQTKDYVASFTLPRRVELNSDKNAILTPPIEAVTQLRIQELDSVGAAKGNLIHLPTTAAEIIVEFDPDIQQMGEFCIEFGHRRYKGLGVRVSSEGLEILTGESTLNNQIRLLAPNAIPKQSIRIFLDVGSIEVYADGGRWTGTYRISSLQEFVSIQIVDGIQFVHHAHVWKLKSAIPLGHSIHEENDRKRKGIADETHVAKNKEIKI